LFHGEWAAADGNSLSRNSARHPKTLKESNPLATSFGNNNTPRAFNTDVTCLIGGHLARSVALAHRYSHTGSYPPISVSRGLKLQLLEAKIAMKPMLICMILLLAFGGFASRPEAKTAVGWASFYKSGSRTANGEHFDPLGFTAAHRSLPFGTRVLVTNLKNGKWVIVRINDRGPTLQSRVLDLSFGAAKVLGLDKLGIAQVKFEELPAGHPYIYFKDQSWRWHCGRESCVGHDEIRERGL
jgi:rare lipoprotein A